MDALSVNRIKKEIQQERRNISYGAKSHIKSIMVAIKRYEKGSPSEKDYALEHAHKLIKYYLEKF